MAAVTMRCGVLTCLTMPRPHCMLSRSYHGNTSYGMASGSTTPVVNAEHYWWGHSTGPLDSSDDRATGGLYNPDGQGNAVSNYIDYEPWLGGSVEAPNPASQLGLAPHINYSGDPVNTATGNYVFQRVDLAAALADLSAAIDRTLEQFARGVPFHDDRTLVVLRREHPGVVALAETNDSTTTS